MTSRRLQRAVQALTAVLTLLAVAGCVSLPDDSDVNSGTVAGVDKGGAVIGNAPAPSQPGQTREQVIAGYLHAMAAYPSNPDVVRSFLTPSAAAGWLPETRVQVYEDASIVLKRGNYHLTTTILGTIDTRGSWTSTPADQATFELPMSMARVSGQWRINNPPPGTLVDTNYFLSYFHQYSLYFFDPTFSLLAPDPVYRRIGAPSATATGLISNLLEGPTRSMAGVVGSAAPPATHLARRVVVSSSGFADVPLAGGTDALQQNTGALKSLAAQIAWTLRQERVGVKSFRITVAGQPLHVQGFPSVDMPVGGFAHYDPAIPSASTTLFALNKGHLVSVSSAGSVNRVLGPIGHIDTLARSVAVNPSATFAALVSRDGSRVIAGGLAGTPADSRQKVWLRGGTDWLRPSIDASGLLWDVDLNHGEATLYVATGQVSRQVEAPGITGKAVTAFAVSRDGMRLAAVVDEGNRSDVVVAMIKRPSDTGNLTLVRLVGPRTITNTDFTRLTGIAWSSPTTVVVLAQGGPSQPQPYEVSVDGSHAERTPGFLPAEIRPVSVAAAPPPARAPGTPSGAPTVIGAEGGLLFAQQINEQWERVPAPAAYRLWAPVYPG